MSRESVSFITPDKINFFRLKIVVLESISDYQKSCYFRFSHGYARAENLKKILERLDHRKDSFSKDLVAILFGLFSQTTSCRLVDLIAAKIFKTSCCENVEELPKNPCITEPAILIYLHAQSETWRQNGSIAASKFDDRYQVYCLLNELAKNLSVLDDIPAKLELFDPQKKPTHPAGFFANSVREAQDKWHRIQKAAYRPWQF